jgi:hypothetical protein
MEHGSDDPAFARYKLGVTMGCWGLFVFAASSAIYACRLKKKNIFFFELFCSSLFGTMVSKQIFFKSALFYWLFHLCTWLHGEFFLPSRCC